MDLGGVLYALAVLLVVYSYLLYPALVLLLGWVRRRPKPLRQWAPRSISVVIAAYNEESSIGRRLQELTDLLAKCSLDGEIIVVSDGSTDGTAGIARSFTNATVRVVEVPTNGGKATALSEGCALAQNEIIL